MKKGSWFNLLIGVQWLWRDLCSHDRISLLKAPPPLVNHLLTASCGAPQRSDYNEHWSSTIYIKAIISNGPLQRQHTVQALFHPTKTQQAISVHQTPKQHEGQKTYSPRGYTSSRGLIWDGQSSRPRRFYKPRDLAYPQMSRNQSGRKCCQEQRSLISAKSVWNFSQMVLSITNKIKIMSQTFNKRQWEGCKAICSHHRKSIQSRCRINSLNQLNTAAILKCKTRLLFQNVACH